MCSLQEICYMYLVGHFDQYPSEYISLLPTTLRNRLLKYLPAVDLHKLTTCTPVTLDDTTTQLLWEQLYKRFCPYRKANTGQYKVALLDRTVHQVLHPYSFSKDQSQPSWISNCSHIGEIIDSLICLPQCEQDLLKHSKLLESCGLMILCEKCHLVYPLRLRPRSLLKPFQIYKDQLLAVCELLVNVFQYYPDTVLHYYHSEYLLKLAPENPIVQKFIAGVRVLKLSCFDPHDNYVNKEEHIKREEHNPQEILCYILSSKQPRFCELFVTGLEGRAVFANFADIQLEFLTPFLANSKLLPQGIMPENFIPYNQLHTLSVTGLNNSYMIEGSLMNLIAIINYQEAVKDVTVKGSLSYVPAIDQLVITLAKLPHLTHVFIGSDCRKFEMSIQSFAELFVNFISLFNCKSLCKSLHLKRVKFVVTKATDTNLIALTSKLTPINFKNGSHLKELVLENVNIPTEVTKFLSSLPSLHLNKLKLVTSLESYADDISFCQYLLNISARDVSITLYDTVATPIVVPLIGDVLNHLLSSVHIKKLQLNGVSFLHYSRQLFSFVEALNLHCQTSHSLNELHLHNCHLGFAIHTAEQSLDEYQYKLKQLFGSILNIVRCSDDGLHLSIDDTTFSSFHYCLLHSLWSSTCKSEGYRFLSLHIKSPVALTGFEDSDSFKAKMDQMACKYTSIFRV